MQDSGPGEDKNWNDVVNENLPEAIKNYQKIHKDDPKQEYHATGTPYTPSLDYGIKAGMTFQESEFQKEKFQQTQYQDFLKRRGEEQEKIGRIKNVFDEYKELTKERNAITSKEATNLVSKLQDPTITLSQKELLKNANIFEIQANPSKFGLTQDEADNAYWDYVMPEAKFFKNLGQTLANVAGNAIFGIPKNLSYLGDLTGMATRLADFFFNESESNYNQTSINLAKQDRDAYNYWYKLSGEEQRRLDKLGIKPSNAAETIRQRTFEALEPEKKGMFAQLGDDFTELGVMWGLIDAKNAENEVDNWFAKIMQTGQDKWNQFVPPVESENAGDAGAWWNMFGSTIQSVIEFAAPAGIVSKEVGSLQKLARTSSAMEKSAILTKGLIKGRVSQGASGVINAALSGAISNRMEGAVMASETYKKTMENFQEAIDSGRMSEEEAKFYASRAASNMDGYNTAFIFADMFALSGLYKGQGWIYKDIAEEGFKGLKKNLTKFNADNLLLQNIKEYGEEAFQGMTENEQVYKAMVKSGVVDMSKYDTDFFTRIAKDFLSYDIQMQGLAGFAGGGIQRVIVKGITGQYGAKVKGDQAKFAKYQQDINNVTNEYFANRIQSFNDYMKKSALAQATDNKIATKMLDDQHFASIVASNFSAGTTHNLENHITDMANANFTEEERIARGLGEDYKQVARQQMATLKEMKKDYMKMTRYENSEEVFMNRTNKKIMAEAAMSLNKEKAQMVSERIKHQTDILSMVVPNVVFEYKVNEETGLAEPSFNHDDYEALWKTVSPKEKQVILNKMKQAEKMLADNEDYQTINKNLKHVNNDIEIAVNSIEALDKDFKAKTSPEYQIAYPKMQQRIKDMADEVAKEVAIKEQEEAKKANDERIQNNIAKHRGLRPTVKKEVVEPVITTTTKEDIERRRQEELNRHNAGSSTMLKYVKDGNNEHLTKEEIDEAEDLIQQSIKLGIKDADRVVRILANAGYVRNSSSSATIFRNYIEDRLNGSLTSPINGKINADINAKYDAELKELESKEQQPTEKPPTEKPVNTTTIKGIYKPDGQTVQLVIEDMPDGSITSYMAENGAVDKKHVKKHPKGTPDAEIIDGYKEFTEDPEIEFGSIHIGKKEDLTKDNIHEVEDALTTSQIEENKQYNTGIDEQLKNEDVQKDLLGELHDEPNPDEAWNTVAHSGRKFEIIDGKRVDIDDEYEEGSLQTLNFDKLQPGTEVKLSVVENEDEVEITDPRTINTSEPSKIKFGDYREAIKNDSDYEQKYLEAVPIEARTSNGEHAFFIHQTSWINDKHVKTANGSEEQEADKRKNRTLRKQVLDKGSVSVQIASYEDGIYFRMSGKKYQRTTDAMPDKDLIIAVVKDNELYDSEDKKIDPKISDNVKNKAEMRKGGLMAVVKINTNTWGAIPLRQNVFGNPDGRPASETTSPYLYDTIERVLTLSFTAAKDWTADDVKFAQALYDSTKINIGRGNKNAKVETAKFLELFLYMKDLEGAVDIQDYFTNKKGKVLKKDNMFVVGSNKGDIIFGIKWTKDSILTRDNIGEFMAFLGGRKKNVDVYFNIKKQYLGANPTIPLFVRNAETGEYEYKFRKYRDIVKDNTNTNIKGRNIGTEENPFWTYTINPKITFETQENEEVRSETPTQKEVDKEEVIQEELAEKKSSSMDKMNEQWFAENKKLQDIGNKLYNLTKDKTPDELYKILGNEEFSEIQDELNSIQGGAMTNAIWKLTSRNPKEVAEAKKFIDELNIGNKKIQPQKKAAIRKINLTDDYMPVIDDAAKQAVAKSVQEFFVEGLTAGEQTEIRRYCVYTIVNAVFSKKKQVSREKIFESIKKEFADIKKEIQDDIANGVVTEIAEIELSNKAIAKIDNILAGWDTIERTVISAMHTIGQIDIVEKNGKIVEKEPSQVETEDGDDYTPEVASTKENANWDSVSAFTIDSKNTSSVKIKMFLSGLQDRKKNKEGRGWTTERTFWGGIRPVGFDEAYDLVQRLLSNSGPERSIETYMQTLKDASDTFPYLRQVVAKLKNRNTETSLRNEFFKVMTKHYVDMRFYQITVKNGEFVSRPYEDNSNSIFRGIQSQWMNQFIMHDSIISAQDTNGNSVMMFNQDIYTKLKEVFDRLYKKALYQDLVDRGKEKMTPEQSYNQKDYEDVLGIFGAFGITLSDASWTAMINGKYKLGKSTDNTPFHKLFINSKSPIKKLLEIAASGTISMEDKIFNKKELVQLARFEEKHSKNLYSNSFISNHKIIFAFSNNKYLMERFFQLKNDRKKLTELIGLHYVQDSSWLKQLCKTDESGQYVIGKDGLVEIDTDSNFYETFACWTASLEPLKTSGKSRANHEMHKLTELEHEVYKIMGIQKFMTSTNKLKRNISVTYFTNSDKTTTMCFDTEAVDINLDIDSNLTEETIEMIYNNVVLPEIRSIKNYNHTLNSKTGLSGYDDGGGSLFYNFPSLNTEVEGLFTVEDIGKGEVSRTINPNILDDSESSKKLRADIKAEVKKSVERLIKEKMDNWEKLGIGISEKTGQYNYMNSAFVREKYSSNDKLKHAASDMVIQHLVANSNFLQLFVGNPAEFFKRAKADGQKLNMSNENIPAHIKSWMDNVGKRLAGDIAPRETMFTENDGSAKYLFVNDPEGPSFNYANILANFIKRFGEKEGTKLAKPYKKITIPDGQELTTVKEHTFWLYKEGKLTDKEFKAINNRIEGAKGGYYTLEGELLSKVLQPVKPVYVQNYVHTTKGIEVRYYVKSSSFPLLPELTRGMGLDNLRLAMEEVGIDRLAFKSAVKSGSTDAELKLFDSDGHVNFKTDRDATVKELVSLMTAKVKGTDEYMHIQDLPRTGMGAQQDVPYKEKAEINKVTQASKNLFTNMLDATGFLNRKTGKEVTGRELQAHYNERYGKLFDAYYKVLTNDIDYTKTKDGYTLDYNKLRKLLISEAESRSWPLSEVEAIKHPDFFNSIAFTSFSDRYESLMASIVSNKIVKSKLPGMSSVLGTEAGFKNKNISVETFKNLIKKKKGIILSENYDVTNGLLPAGIRADGKWHPAQAIVPWKIQDPETHKPIDIKQFMTADNMLDLSKIDEDVLKIIGMRIPSQGLNSSSLIEIVGFTTEHAGDLFIATKDFIVQMGSDFDIDKLYSYMTPATIVDGKLVRYADTLNEEELEVAIKSIEAKIELEKNKTQDMDSLVTKDDVEKTIGDLKKDLKKLHQQYIKLIQTDIIDVHKAVFGNTNPEVQDAITMPLTNWILEDKGNELDGFRRRRNTNKYEVASPLSDEYQKMKYINATAGKDGVAIFSLDNIFNSLCQYAGDMKIYDDLKNGKEMNVRFGNKVSNGDLSHARGLTGDKVYEGEYKSNIIQGYQSVSVDNEKLQVLYKLNINKYTFNTIKLLNQLGFGEEVIYFINQPIIIEYINEIKKLRGQFDKFNANPEDAAREMLVKKYSQEYYDIAAREKEAGQTPPTYQSDAGLEVYKEMFENETLADPQEYANTQCAILDKFIYLNAKGHELGFLESTSNIDSGGIGKNIPEIIIKGRNVEKVLEGKTNIANAYKIFGTKDEQDVFHAGTINGYAYEKGLKLAKDLWLRFFKYDTKAFQQTMDQVEAFSSYKADSVEGQADTMRDIWEAQRAYLFASANLWNLPNGNSISWARKNLMFDDFTVKMFVNSDGLEQTDVKQEKENHKSFANVISEIKALPIGNNMYLRKLAVSLAFKPGTKSGNKNGDIIESNNPSIVKFDAASKEAIGEHEVYQAFLDLIVNDRPILNKDRTPYMVNGEEYRTSQLASDAILYAYLTGAKQEAIQFLKYVPPTFLHSTGIFAKLAQIEFANGDIFGHKADLPNHPSYITKQIFQHNPGSVPQIDAEKIVDVTKSQNVEFEKLAKDKKDVKFLTSFVLPKTISKKSKLRLDESSPMPFISIRNNNAASKYSLYEYVGLDDEGHFKYSQIDTLGLFGMSEFVAGVGDVRSLVATNRSTNEHVNATSTTGIQSPFHASEQRFDLGDSRITAKSKYKFEDAEGKQAKDKIDSILTTMSKEGHNPLFKNLAADLLEAIDSLPKDIKLKIGEFSQFNVEDNSITINMEQHSDVDSFERAFMHELLHAFTSTQLRLLDGDRTSLAPDQRKSLENMEKLFHTYRDFFRNHVDIDMQIRFKIFERKAKILKMYTNNQIPFSEAVSMCKLAEKAISKQYGVTDDKYHTTKDDAKSITDLYTKEDRVLFYAGTNVREFVSEVMTNQDVIDQASQIEYKEEGQPSKKVISKFKEFVKGIVKAFTKRSVSEAAIDEVLSFITPTTRVVSKEERPIVWETKKPVHKADFGPEEEATKKVKPTSGTVWETEGKEYTKVDEETLSFDTPEDNKTEEASNNSGSYLDEPGIDLFLPVSSTPHLKFFNQNKKSIQRYSRNKNVTFKEFMEILNNEPDVDAFYHVITRC